MDTLVVRNRTRNERMQDERAQDDRALGAADTPASRGKQAVLTNYGAALRLIYHRTIDEEIPEDLIKLLDKLR